MEFLVFVPQMWFGVETSHGVAKYRLFSRATILIRVPNKDSALAAMFREPSYAAKDSNLVSSFPFIRDGFFRLKSIRISISPRSCWFLSKVHEACELGIVSLSRLYSKKQLPQRHAHFWTFSQKTNPKSDFLSKIFPWISSKKPKATGKILIFSSFQMPDSLNDSKNLSFRAM